jgi:hypothetical protein
MFWDDLRGKVEAMYQVYTEEWAITLRTESARLEIAITAREPARIKEAFWRYRRQAGDRFFRVDTDLKRLCDRLRQFRNPFIEFLRVTELP